MRSTLAPLFTLLVLLTACDSKAGGGAPGPAPTGPGASAPETKSGSPSVPAAPIDPATTGVVRGKVAFDGKPPADKKISVDADPYCAGMHTEALMTEFYKVNAKGEVQNVFVYVKKGLEGRSFAPPAEPVTLDQKGCQYVPHVVGVMAGQPIRVRNSDETMHNIHAMPKLNGEFNFSQATKGQESTKQFATPEIMVKVKCDVHGWMGCFIGVVAHPFYAVTGEDGAFELKGLPPGEYVIEAWHEKFGTQTATVKLEAKETKDVAFTFKGN